MSTNNNSIDFVSSVEGTYYGTGVPTSGAYKVGDTYYQSPLGTSADAPNATAMYRWNGVAWIKNVGSSSTPLNPELVPVRDFKTQAEIDALATGSPLPNDGTSYIVTDGTNKGNIATWDEATSSWIYYVPADLDVTTVTNPDNETFQGKWRYDITGDYWVQISEGIVLPDVVERPVSAENIAFGRTTMPMTFQWSTGWSYAFIQNDRVSLWGNTNVFTTASGSNSDGSFPRKLSWNWYNGANTAAYAPNAQYTPKFTDVVHTDAVMLALDHKGKVWAMGNQVEGTGMTTTPTSTVATSRPPLYGLSPIPYFQGLTNVFISKIYANNNKYSPPQHNTAAVDTDGNMYVCGNNSFGQLALGNQTARAGWVQVTQVSNVIDVKMTEYTVFALQADGKLYIWGHNPLNTGTGVATTTPQLLTSDVAQFDFHQDANGANVLSLMVVKTDGTVWGIGNNASGQLGIGNTTNSWGTFKQSLGVNNAKSVFCSRGVGAAVITGIIRTDGTVSFVGRNNEGQFGYTVGTAAATYTTFVTPAFSAQGTIIEGMIGRTTTLRTASGDIWNAGHFGMRGLGETGTANTWVNSNKFQKVPLPEPALAMRGNQSSSTAGNNDNCYVLTANYGIIVWGSNYPAYISINHQQYCYSPYMVDAVRFLNNGIDVENPLGGKYDKAGTITGITAGSISDVLDGQNNQYIKVNLTINGTVGKLTTTGATLTGADLTSTLQTQYVYVSATTGNQVTLVFKVNATDLIPTGGASQTQNWVVTLGGFTYNLTSNRFNDIIAEKLSTSLQSYLDANVGDYIPITLAEWSSLGTITNVATAGKVDAASAYTTNGSWTTLGIVYNARTSATNSATTLPIPANRYVFAFQVKTGTAITAQTYALGVLPAQTNAGLELVGQNGATNIANTLQEFKAFVVKGGKLVTQSSDIAVWGGSFALKGGAVAPTGGLTNYAGGTGANTAPLTTTSLPTAATNLPYFQALHEPTGFFTK